MAAIPKIKISTNRKRECIKNYNTSSTTANFGVVQPTFCREMMPNSSYSVNVKSKIRLAGMPVPTFGEMYLSNRHVFVPYRDVCPQFDSFIAGQPYTAGGRSSSYYPETLPPMKLSLHCMEVLAEWADWTIYKKNDYSDESKQDEYLPVLFDKQNNDASQLAALVPIWDDILGSSLGYVFNKEVSNRGTYHSCLPNARSSAAPRGIRSSSLGCLRLGNWYCTADNWIEGSALNYNLQTASTGQIYVDKTGYYVTLEAADYVSVFGSEGQYLIAFALKPTGKRIRSIMLGLGYQFTPNLWDSINDCNWLKLLAFYKAWWSLYRPKRELSFTQSPCYAFIKEMEAADAESLIYVFSNSNVVGGNAHNFINALGQDCYAYLPNDYFGMSVVKPAANYSGSDISFVEPYANSYAPNASQTTSVVRVIPTNDGTSNLPSVKSNSSDPMAVKLAMQVLKYVNKNTIVGRSIADYIKAHFGVSIDSSHDLDTVYEIGSNSVDIQIADIYSTAETEDMAVGDYAGRGIGVSDNKDIFTFSNKDNFGVWITLTSIMPKSGYYQGILKENESLTKYQFFTPEFDAAGYEVVSKSELSADYPVSLPTWNPSNDNGTQLKQAFGFNPRYSFYKVGRNVVSGDLSLRSQRNQLAPYTLDRMIPYDSYRGWMHSAGGMTFAAPVLRRPYFVPSVVYDEFRRIDPSDHLGNYNRIFNYESNDLDHFIIHQIFNVEAWLPAMSLSESFDTFEKGHDEVNIVHS